MKKIIFILIFVLAFLLRFFQLGKNPPSLYWDEASLGYNAYTIATSGRDEHGEFLPLARFIAFGDYKPPGYIYATVPSIFLFGLTPISVRLPSFTAGVFMVLMTFLLTKELFGKKRIAFFASFLLAVSPWGIQFSRAAFEANLATFFNLSALYFFIVSLRKRPMIFLSVLFFILSFYTFNANRIIAPILLMALLFLYRKNIFHRSGNIKWLLISFISGFLLLLPSVSYLASRESKLRFQEVSIFNNLEPIKVSNQRIATDQGSWWAKILHNRRILFAVDFLKHYFDNFSGRFLFTHGDVNPRLSIQELGELYIWDLPFLLIGFYLMIRNKEKAFSLLAIWMVIAPIPAATAKETPHALRILSIMPTYQIIAAYGLSQLTLWLNKLFKIKFYYSSSLFFICLLLSFNIYYYLHNYYIHYPSVWSGEWQYGYKEMVTYVSSVASDYDQIFVTEAYGRPYIFFAFYNRYPLEEFIKDRVAQRDWFGFWNVSKLGKIKFKFDDLRRATGKILIVGTERQIPDDAKILKEIKNLSGETVFLIAEKT